MTDTRFDYLMKYEALLDSGIEPRKLGGGLSERRYSCAFSADGLPLEQFLAVINRVSDGLADVTVELDEGAYGFRIMGWRWTTLPEQKQIDAANLRDLAARERAERATLAVLKKRYPE